MARVRDMSNRRGGSDIPLTLFRIVTATAGGAGVFFVGNCHAWQTRQSPMTKQLVWLLTSVVTVFLLAVLRKTKLRLLLVVLFAFVLGAWGRNIYPSVLYPHGLVRISLVELPKVVFEFAIIGIVLRLMSQKPLPLRVVGILLLGFLLMASVRLVTTGPIQQTRTWQISHFDLRRICRLSLLFSCCAATSFVYALTSDRLFCALAGESGIESLALSPIVPKTAIATAVGTVVYATGYYATVKLSGYCSQTSNAGSLAGLAVVLTCVWLAKTRWRSAVPVLVAFVVALSSVPGPVHTVFQTLYQWIHHGHHEYNALGWHNAAYVLYGLGARISEPVLCFVSVGAVLMLITRRPLSRRMWAALCWGALLLIIGFGQSSPAAGYHWVRGDMGRQMSLSIPEMLWGALALPLSLAFAARPLVEELDNDSWYATVPSPWPAALHITIASVAGSVLLAGVFAVVNSLQQSNLQGFNFRVMWLSWEAGVLTTVLLVALLAESDGSTLLTFFMAFGCAVFATNGISAIGDVAKQFAGRYLPCLREIGSRLPYECLMLSISLGTAVLETTIIGIWLSFIAWKARRRRLVYALGVGVAVCTLGRYWSCLLLPRTIRLFPVAVVSSLGIFLPYFLSMLSCMVAYALTARVLVSAVDAGSESQPQEGE